MTDNRTRPPISDDIARLNVEFVKAIREALHRSETRVLQALATYAGSVQMHFTDLERSHSSIRKRLGSLETRLVEVEKRLNIPPTA